MRNNDRMDILWVGKFDFRKQLGLALRVMEQLRSSPNIHLHILGAGNDEENARYQGMAENMVLTNTVTFHGKIPHNDVIDYMNEADLFLFTSISDETSTVILEALGCSLPIACFDACGFGPIVTPDVGRKVTFSNPMQSVMDFKNVILELYSQPELLKKMSEDCSDKCKTLTWEFKAGQMVGIYKKLYETEKYCD